MQKKRQEEIGGLRDDLQQLSSKLESLEIDIKKMSASKQQVTIVFKCTIKIKVKHFKKSNNIAKKNVISRSKKK